MSMDFNVVCVTKDQFQELIKQEPETSFSMTIITESGVLEAQECLVVGLCIASDDRELLKVINLRTGRQLYIESEE